MPHDIVTRKQGSLSIAAAGQKQVFELQRGNILRNIDLRFSGQATMTAAVAAADWNRGDEWGFFQRIDVVANGSDYIRSFSGVDLAELNRQVLGFQRRLSNTIGDLVPTLTPLWDSILRIPFAMPQPAHTPVDTALDTRRLQKLTLEVTTEAFANVAKGGHPPTAVAATLDICSTESNPGDAAVPVLPFRITPLNIAGTATNAAADMQLPTNCSYRGFLINCADISTFAGGVDKEFINNVKLVSGQTVFFDLPWAVIRDRGELNGVAPMRQLAQRAAANADVANLDTFTTLNPPSPALGTGPFLRGAKSPNLDVDAWAFIDLCEDGYLTEAVNAADLSELKLTFDVQSGANAWNIRVYPFAIFPPPPQMQK